MKARELNAAVISAVVETRDLGLRFGENSEGMMVVTKVANGEGLEGKGLKGRVTVSPPSTH